MKGKVTMKKRKITLSLSLALSFTLPLNTVLASSIDDPVALLSKGFPDSYQYVSVDSPLVLQFSFKVQTDLAQLPNVIFKVGGVPSGTLTAKTAKAVGNTLTITPTTPFDMDKDYSVEIPAALIQDASGTPLTGGPLTINFSTHADTFDQLLVKIDDMLNNQQITPRDIKITSPKRYINEVDVVQKKDTTTSTTDPNTGSITNIDIKVDSSVPFVNINILDKTSGTSITSQRAVKVLSDNGVSKTFIAAFEGLPDNYDIEVMPSDSTSQLDHEIMSFAADSTKLTTEIKKPFKYVTGGKTFILYDLIRSQANFQAILNENTDQTKIKYQITAR
jgi:hypothetical protein